MDINAISNSPPINLRVKLKNSKLDMCCNYKEQHKKQIMGVLDRSLTFNNIFKYILTLVSNPEIIPTFIIKPLEN